MFNLIFFKNYVDILPEEEEGGVHVVPIVVGVICALIGTIALYFLIRRLYPNAFVSISKNVINFIFDSVLIFIFFKYESPMGSQGPGIEWRNFLLQCCSVVLNCIHGRRRLAH